MIVLYRTTKKERERELCIWIVVCGSVTDRECMSERESRSVVMNWKEREKETLW